MHWTINVLLILSLAGFTSTTWAQKQYKPKFKKKSNSLERVFPDENVFKPGGWQFGAGVTGLLNFAENQHSLPNNENTFTTRGRIFPFVALEVGRYYNFKPTFTFSYLNYGLSYKGWGASEKFDVSGNEGSHSNLSHYLSGYFDINSTIPVSKMHFIQNSVGINVDYGFPSEGNNYPGDIQSAVMPDFLAGINYKLGWGIKPDTDIIFVPYVQVNLYNIHPRQNDFYRYDVFNTSYIPVIVGIRMMLFNLNTDSCPDVDNSQLPEGFKNGYGL